MLSKSLCLGVDFGTCNTVVAGLVGHTKLKTCSLPSSALYDETQDKFFYGSSVQINKYEFTLLKNEKRLIGRKYEQLDSIEKSILKLTKKENKYYYTNKKQTYYLSPIQFASNVIQNIVDEAYRENIQKNTVKKCVMSVPAIYSCIRKNGIKQAFERADFHLIGIITDTSATALYLVDNKKDMEDGIIMIYDLGGGIFDVSFVEKKKNRLIVIGSGGDEHLGGEDVLNELINYVAKKVEEKINIFQDTYIYRSVSYECENYIKYHEKGGIKPIKIDETLRIDITEDILENIQKRFYEKTIKIVNNTIAQCNLDKKNINYIACVGGCSNNNMIINMLRNNFNSEIITELDYAVAEGAKLYAKYIETNDYEYIIEDSTYPLYKPSFGIYLDTTSAYTAYLKEAGKISESLEVIGKYDLPLDVIEYDKIYSLRSNKLSFSKLLKSIVKKSNDKLQLYKNFPVIISIPTEFGIIQRYEIVKIAEKECNLKVTQLINNTTASAVYYCKKENKNDCNIIVCDIRKETFSLSFISVNEGILNMKGIETDNHLGCENMTNDNVNFNKTFDILETMRKKYDDKKELNILLVGESTNISNIKEIIRLKYPQTYINVDELYYKDFCRGAVVCAQSLYDGYIEHYEFKDVLSHSIGIEVNKIFSVHHMDKVLTKMAVLPVENDVEVYLDQGKRNIEIYEGESMNTQKNKYVGSIEVSAPEEYKDDKVKLTFIADINGVLKIIAKFNTVEIEQSINFHN